MTLRTVADQLAAALENARIHVNDAVYESSAAKGWRASECRDEIDTALTAYRALPKDEGPSDAELGAMILDTVWDGTVPELSAADLKKELAKRGYTIVRTGEPE